MGHELIHALHNAKGVKDNNRKDSFSFTATGIIDGVEQTGTVTILSFYVNLLLGVAYPTEEVKTIGLEIYENNNITENKLREDLGYDRRFSY